MKMTVVTATGAVLAALTLSAAAPANAGVSLSIGLNLPIAPGVRLGGVITNRPWGPAFVARPAPYYYPAPVYYDVPVVYPAPVAYFPPRRVVYGGPRRVIYAPPPRWGGPRTGPIAYSAPGDFHRGGYGPIAGGGGPR